MFQRNSYSVFCSGVAGLGIMLRYSVILALICACLFSILPANAEDYLAGDDVEQLAKAIVNYTKTHNELPAAYDAPYANNTMIIRITTPMAFEILARTIIQWNTTGAYPDKVNGVGFDLRVPQPDAGKEIVKSPGSFTPVATADIFTYAKTWLDIAPSVKNTLQLNFQFPARYKLSIAEFMLAMSMLINDFQTFPIDRIPATMAVPFISLPQNIDDTSHPLAVVMRKVIVPSRITVTMNGVGIVKDNVLLPDGQQQVLCGSINLTITATGPIAIITVSADEKELTTFKKAGEFGYVLNSLELPDKVILLTFLVMDEEGNQVTNIQLPLNIQNGRYAPFTPAQLEENPPVASTT